MKRFLFLLLTILTLLFLSSCGGPGGTDPIDPTDPTTTTDPTDPTTTTDPTDPTTTTDPTFPFPVDPVDPTTTTDPTSPTTVDMTGTWTGTTTSDVYGNQTTTFALAQSGTTLSGTLLIEAPNQDGQVIEFEGSATGTVTGSSATISAAFPYEGGGQITYSYQGNVTGTTYSGTVTLTDSGGQNATGTFNLTQGGSTTDPSDPTVTTDPTDPSDGISGTVTAPSGDDVTGTLVFACADEACTSPVNASPYPLDSTGIYSITGLQTVPHLVLAGKDVDNNGFGVGDYIGVAENVTPPATGVNIEMVVYTGAESPVAKQLNNMLERRNKLQQFKRAP